LRLFSIINVKIIHSSEDKKLKLDMCRDLQNSNNTNTDDEFISFLTKENFNYEKKTPTENESGGHLNTEYIKHADNDEEGIKNLKKHIKELPKGVVYI